MWWRYEDNAIEQRKEWLLGLFENPQVFPWLES